MAAPRAEPTAMLILAPVLKSEEEEEEEWLPLPVPVEEGDVGTEVAVAGEPVGIAISGLGHGGKEKGEPCGGASTRNLTKPCSTSRTGRR